MNKPETYAEWVNCFEQFKAGTKDEETILLMEQGQIEWTKGVAERLTQQLYETIDHRLRRSSDQLQKELSTCNGNETELVKAILSARKRLAVLKRVAHLSAFPERVRETMWNLLHEYAKSTQQSLEDSAVTDRTGRIRSLIRNNPITQFDQIENVFGITPHEASNPEATGNPQRLEQNARRRRIILP